MVEYQIVVYDAPIWTVYMHVNKVNRKKYVGITSRNVKRRWKGGYGYHPRKDEKPTAFYNAIQKYGWDNFDHYILLNNITQIMASIMEQILIVYYNTHIKNGNGYNIAAGGFGFKGVLRDIKPLIKRQRNYGKKVVCLNNGKVFNSIKEAANYYKINSSSITCVCQGLSQYAGYDSDNNYLLWMYYEDYIKLNSQQIDDFKNKVILRTNSRPVICLNFKQTFLSIKAASEFYHCSQSGIKSCCDSYSGVIKYDHKRQHCGRDATTGQWLSWMYYDEYQSLPQYKQNELLSTERPNGSSRFHIPVICLNSLEVLPSSNEIINVSTSKTHTNMRRACVDQTKSCGRHLVTNEFLHWMYYEDYKKLSNEKKQELKEQYYTGNFLLPENQSKEVYNENK